MGLRVISASGSSISLEGKQGATWTLPLKIYSDEEMTTPINLTGYSARGRIAESFTAGTAIAEFVCTFGDRSAGELTISVPSSVTATFSWTSGMMPFVFDVEIYTGDPEEVTIIFDTGKIVLIPRVPDL